MKVQQKIYELKGRVDVADVANEDNVIKEKLQFVIHFHL